jgi:hypothetical protein
VKLTRRRKENSSPPLHWSTSTSGALSGAGSKRFTCSSASFVPFLLRSRRSDLLLLLENSRYWTLAYLVSEVVLLNTSISAGASLYPFVSRPERRRLTSVEQDSAPTTPSFILPVRWSLSCVSPSSSLSSAASANPRDGITALAVASSPSDSTLSTKSRLDC